MSTPNTVELFNLATGTTLVFCGVTPKMALICADHQSRKDFSTWAYPKEGDVTFRETDLTLGLGDFSYLKPEAKDPAFIRRALATRDALLDRAADKLQDYCDAATDGEINDSLAEEIRAKVFPC